MYGQQRGFGPRRMAPVKIGDELDVEIESVGEKGDGIAKKEGFVIFVPGTQKGDKVRVRITKVFRKVGFGEVVGAAAEKEIEEPTEPEAEAKPEEKKPTKPVSEKSERKPKEPAEDTETFGEELNE